MQVHLINGCKISLKGADNPDTMRGVSLDSVILDEYADMKPETWEQVLQPALTDRKGDAVFIGTPKGRNHFYDIYLYAVGGEDEDWAGWQFTSHDNETLDPEELKKRQKNMSSFAYRQEHLASFEASGSEQFKEEWIKFSEKNPLEDGDYYIAVDLAGFEEVNKASKGKSRLDNTAIAVVYVGQGGWYVEDIICGRWELNETARRIFQAVERYRPVKVGIEKGIARQAVMSPLTDLMRRRGTFFNVVELTHGNRKKADRIMWSLQGKFENGWIYLNKGPWNIQFMDELFQFPDPLTRDDMIDALSYIDQLYEESFFVNHEIDEYEVFDVVSGY